MKLFKVSFVDKRDGFVNEKLLQTSTESEVFTYMAYEGHEVIEVEERERK